MTIRILIADDHTLVAESLSYLIGAQSGMAVIGCVRDGREAVRVALKERPDIVVMDNAMPQLNGTEATHIICSRRPQARVIMLSMYSDPVHVCRALQAGATGYVIKKSVATELVAAIRAVHEGRRYLSKPLADGVIEQFVSSSPFEDPAQRLSARERQVLQMIAEGHSVNDIAFTLSLSPKTVETYRARMMTKLDIHDVVGLVKFAIQQGFAALD